MCCKSKLLKKRQLVADSNLEGQDLLDNFFHQEQERNKSDQSFSANFLRNERIIFDELFSS